MKKIILEVLKKVSLSICMIYAFDIIGGGLSIFIPINFITIGVISFLGVSGLMAIIGVYYALL